MENNNKMMGQRFTDQNYKFDTGEYLKLYTQFRQDQVTYTHEFKEEKAHTVLF